MATAAKKKSTPKKAPTKKKAVKRPVAKAVKAAKPVSADEALSNWGALNDALRSAKVDEAKALLEAEKKGRCRPQYLLRIYSRYNLTRAANERAELVEFAHKRAQA